MVKELLFDDAYLSRVIDDMKLWFTRMEVLDLIYRQFFSNANSFGRQPTTSWYFQSLAPRTLALPAAAIHCVLSEYASGTKATGMFSQDAYRGTFGPSPVTEFSLEAIALSVTHQSAALYPPCGAHQSSSALHSLDWSSSISFRSQFLPFRRSLILSFWIGIPLSHSTLHPPLPLLRSRAWELLNSHRRPYDAFRTPYPPLFSTPPLG